MGRMYTELLKDIPCIQLPLVMTEYAENNYWIYGIVVNESLGINVDEIMQRLEAKGIGTRPFFYPMHQQPILKKMGFFEGEKYFSINGEIFV